MFFKKIIFNLKKSFIVLNYFSKLSHLSIHCAWLLLLAFSSSSFQFGFLKFIFLLYLARLVLFFSIFMQYMCCYLPLVDDAPALSEPHTYNHTNIYIYIFPCGATMSSKWHNSVAGKVFDWCHDKRAPLSPLPSPPRVSLFLW